MAGEYNITLSDGTPLGTIYPLEVNGPDNRSTPRQIQNVTTGSGAGSPLGSFVINSDLTFRFIAGFTFDVQRSGGGKLDGTYTVAAGGSIGIGSPVTRTVIPVIESVGFGSPPAGLPYGEIEYTVPNTPGSPNTEINTSISLPGRGTLNYGELILESMVHMLENFSSNVSPEGNVNLGSNPFATPLTGQLWFDPSAPGFFYWDGAAWTNVLTAGPSSVTFTDAENPAGGSPNTATIHLAGTESNIPGFPLGGSPTGASGQPGFVIWPDTASSAGDALFRVLSIDGNERLRVEHNGTLSTTNNLDVGGIANVGGTGQFGGSVGINNVPPGGSPNLIFEVTGNAQINGTARVTGTTQLEGRVGINNPPPGGSPTNVWLEVTGDIQANSQFLGLSDGSPLSSRPTFSFTNDPNTGMYRAAANELAFATDGTESFRITAAGALQVPGGSPDPYTPLVVSDNIITNKKYVDDTIAAATPPTSWREPVIVRDQTLRANEAAFPTGSPTVIDGVSISTGDRVLFSDVTTVADRDIYVWNGATWDRDSFGSPSRTVGDATYVQDGTDAGKVFAFDVNDEWSLISGAGGGGGTFFTREVVTVPAPTGSPVTYVFTLTNPYRPSADGSRLLVFVDGVKFIKDVGYTEDGTTQVTLTPNSPLVGDEEVEFYALVEATSNAFLNYELLTLPAGVGSPISTGSPTTSLITFASITYVLGSDGLLVYLNGQKSIKDVDYTETSTTTITWIGTPLEEGDTIEAYAGTPITAGTTLGDIDDVDISASPGPSVGDILVFDGINWVSQGAGALLDEIVATAGSPGTAFTTTNVTVGTKTTRSFQQVFVNGVLQKESDGSPPTGNYFVTAPSTITFHEPISASADVIVYQL